MALSDLGEFAFLHTLWPRLRRGPGVIVGAGDDCAVVAVGRRRWLLTTDTLVEGVHFRRQWLTPRQLGRKAYLVNASDIAAMGGQPRFCLVSAGVPADYPARALAEIHSGIDGVAHDSGARVVGGNLSRARALFISITLVGDAPPRPLLRRGAHAGDLLFVTGTLGVSALGVRQLQRDAHARGAAVRRFREPPNRLAAGALLARARIASAAIDVSDGLVQDLGHLCRASGVGARVEIGRLPCPPPVRRQARALALHGGEDYELLCAVPPRRLRRLEKVRDRFGCAFTHIGEIVAQRFGLRIVGTDGRLFAPMAGFDHFARAPR